jgi:hypothetical protein
MWTRKATTPWSRLGSSTFLYYTKQTCRFCDNQDVISETRLPYLTSCWLGVSRMSTCWISMLPTWHGFKTLFNVNGCQPVQSHMTDRGLETLPVSQATDSQVRSIVLCGVGFEIVTAVWVNSPFFCRMTLLWWTFGSPRFEGTYLLPSKRPVSYLPLGEVS